MSHLQELIDQLCPDGVEYKKLGEVVSLERGKRVVRKQLSETEGYPVYQNSLTPLGYYYQSNYPKDSTFIIVAGAAGEIGYSDKDFWAADDCFVIVCPEHVSSRYIYHFLLNRQQSLYSKVRKASIPRLPRQAIDNIKIPVPPMAVQREIVRILDDYSARTAELVKELEVELEARKKQYEFYRDQLLSFDDVREGRTADLQWKMLGDIATVTKLAGFEFTKYVTYSETGNVIALRGLNVKNGKLDLSDVKYIDQSDLSKLERSKLHIGDMLFTYVGTIGQVALVDKEDKYYLAPNVALIRCDKKILLPEFMRYYFQSTQFWDRQINRLLQSSSMKNIPMGKIRQFKICCPPFAEQERIVAILDRFDALCNDLTSGLPAEIAARQKQFEYYRDKLLSFPESK